eukprot:CAMPEP_0171184686 /NCGR_PEP_ID=MMETSP0790-20130122/15912_1 /TAXON_ID=2925 /ORGANISM="Alexandrium catenella, Strain OF101" /LENGTH=138 /DNA_ID=CAMNT_0011649681 /DNA_START=60 /DNA_END=472 /DNA_ORIENTATION=-
MELKFESVGTTRLPPCCHIGVRIGDTLKQGRYEPERCFSFPHAQHHQNARIDIYQHIGSCSVAVAEARAAESAQGLAHSGQGRAGQSVQEVSVEARAAASAQGLAHSGQGRAGQSVQEVSVEARAAASAQGLAHSGQG